MKTLMIYIPSFNRCAKLKKQVDCIKDTIIKEDIQNIFIYINDNASTEEEYLSLSDKYSSFEFIRVHRNNTNIGMIGNIIKAFEINNDDYIWVLSDDDKLDVNILPLLSVEIKKGDMDFFYLKGNIKGDESVSDGQIFDSLNEYLKEFSSLSMMGLISSNIYSKKIVYYMEYMYLYGNTMFPHVAGMLKMMNEEPFKLKCLGDRVISWLPSTREHVSSIDHAIINFLFLSEILSKENQVLLKKKFLLDFGVSHLIKISLHGSWLRKKAIMQIGLFKYMQLYFIYKLKYFAKKVIRRK